MDCCERSRRGRALVAELRAMLEWDSLDQRPGVVLERHDMDGRVAWEMRRSEIVAELNALRQAWPASFCSEIVTTQRFSCPDPAFPVRNPHRVISEGGRVQSKRECWRRS